MKLFLAIALFLMLLSLSTGAETSDNRASRSATALRDRLLGPKSRPGQYDSSSDVTSHLQEAMKKSLLLGLAPSGGAARRVQHQTGAMALSNTGVTAPTHKRCGSNTNRSSSSNTANRWF